MNGSMCQKSCPQEVFRDRGGTVPVDETDEIGFIGMGSQALFVMRCGNVFLPPASALALKSRGPRKSAALLEFPDTAQAA